MLTDQDKEILAMFERWKTEAAQRGAVIRFSGFGVLVACLPQFGNAEQLLLAAPPTPGPALPPTPTPD